MTNNNLHILLFPIKQQSQQIGYRKYATHMLGIVTINLNILLQYISPSINQNIGETKFNAVNNFRQRHCWEKLRRGKVVMAWSHHYCQAEPLSNLLANSCVLSVITVKWSLDWASLFYPLCQSQQIMHPLQELRDQGTLHHQYSTAHWDPPHQIHAAQGRPHPALTRDAASMQTHLSPIVTAAINSFAGTVLLRTICFII